MSVPDPTLRQDAALEVVDRLAAVRTAASAILEGRWLPEPDTLDALG